jgi:hypothetical protein
LRIKERMGKKTIMEFEKRSSTNPEGASIASITASAG